MMMSYNALRTLFRDIHICKSPAILDLYHEFTYQNEDKPYPPSLVCDVACDIGEKTLNIPISS